MWKQKRISMCIWMNDGDRWCQVEIIVVNINDDSNDDDDDKKCR